MYGMSSGKTGRCRVRQVAVVKKWPLVDVRMYKNILHIKEATNIR